MLHVRPLLHLFPLLPSKRLFLELQSTVEVIILAEIRITTIRRPRFLLNRMQVHGLNKKKNKALINPPRARNSDPSLGIGPNNPRRFGRDDVDYKSVTISTQDLKKIIAQMAQLKNDFRENKRPKAVFQHFSHHFRRSRRSRKNEFYIPFFALDETLVLNPLPRTRSHLRTKTLPAKGDEPDLLKHPSTNNNNGPSFPRPRRSRRRLTPAPTTKYQYNQKFPDPSILTNKTDPEFHT